MTAKNIRNILIFIPFYFLFAACAASPREHPTHYWQADKAKTAREYRIDNGTCNEEFAIDENAPLPTESPSFAAYRNCMIEKGYVLRSYF